MSRLSPAPPKRSKSPRSPNTSRGRNSSINDTDASDSDGNLQSPRYSVRSNNTSLGLSSPNTNSQRGDISIKSNESLTTSPYGSGSDVRTQASVRGNVRSPSGSDTSWLYPDLSSPDPLQHDDGPGKSSDRRPAKGKTSPLYPDLSEERRRTSPRQARDSFPYEKTKKMKDNNEDGSNVWIYTLLLIIVAFAAFMGTNVFFSNGHHSSPPVPRDAFETYVSSVEKLRHAFPGQSNRLWRMVKASSKHVLNVSEPEYPVVILMASHNSNADVARCIAQRLASLYEHASNGRSVHPSMIPLSDIQTFKHLPDATQKEKLDADLNTAFSVQGRQSVVVNNLQLLAPEAALILHGYCDNDNAPFKQVLILLNLYADPQQLKLDPSGSSSQVEVEGYIRRVWGPGLVSDKLDALLSRIGNNIAVVTSESQDDLKAACS